MVSSVYLGLFITKLDGAAKGGAIISIAKGSFGSSDVLVSVSPFTQEFDNAFGDQIKETFLNIDE